MAYKTKQSQSILNLLEENKNRHLTAEEIYELLKETDSPAGQATVYRQLDKFTKDGLVQKFSRGDGDGACYQIVPSTGSREHYHLKCIECGKLYHAECDFLNELATHIEKEHGFRMDKSKTVFYGICATCAKKEKKTK